MGEFRPSRPGERRGGRRKGTPNRLTADMRTAIAEAAELVGKPKLIKGRWVATGEGGMTGYFVHLALNKPETFGPLLGKVIPAKVEVERSVTLEMLVLGAQKAREREKQALQAQVNAGLIIEGQAIESPPAAISEAAKSSKR